MKSQNDPATVLGSADVRRVLERAAALDAGGDLLTVDDLRRIAADAQISPAAVELALAELRAGGSMPAAKPKRRGLLRRLGRAITLLAAGLSLGPLVVMAEPDGFGAGAALVFLGSTAAFTLVRGLYHRWRGGLLRFQTELGLLMAGATLSVGLFRGTTSAQVSLIWWLVLAVVGTALVELTARSWTRAAD